MLKDNGWMDLTLRLENHMHGRAGAQWRCDFFTGGAHWSLTAPHRAPVAAPWPALGPDWILRGSLKKIRRGGGLWLLGGFVSAAPLSCGVEDGGCASAAVLAARLWLLMGFRLVP